MQKLLFTGGTGFLGKNIMPLLKERYEVTTCGITPYDMVKADLAKIVPELPERYDIVLHACGKAHVVPKTEEEKQAFYDVNLIGTIHLCDALEKVGVPKALVFISTVAVYGCEFGEMFLHGIIHLWWSLRNIRLICPFFQPLRENSLRNFVS